MRNNVDEKGLTSTDSGPSERPPLDSQQSSLASLDGRLGEVIDRAEALLRREFGSIIDSDPKQFRRAMLAQLKRRFVLPVGRRRSTELDRAEQLRAEGNSIGQIARLIEPGYAKLDPYRKKVCRDRIASGLRARRKKREVFLPDEKRGS